MELSQAELATQCNWNSQSRVANYEKDLREPSLDDLAMLATFFQCSPGWLAFGEGPEPELTAIDKIEVFEVVEGILDRSIESIDRKFGAGAAVQNPGLVQAYVNAVMTLKHSQGESILMCKGLGKES